MEDVTFWAQCFYFFCPAFFANIIPVLASRFGILPSLAMPIDQGRNWLGPHKTVRGFLLGTTTAIAVTYCQTALDRLEPFSTLSLLDYSRVQPLLLGFLLGFGSLVGDSMGSFAKRRLNIQPGKHLWFVDEISMAVGAIIFLAILYPSPSSYKITIVLTLLTLTFLWHLAATRTAYATGIKNVRW